MDTTSLIGIGAFLALIGTGAATGQLPSMFLNTHALIIVLGGSLSAVLISTPSREFVDALRSAASILRDGRYPDGKTTVAQIVALAQQVQTRGVAAFREVDPQAAGGYLARATAVALEYNDVEIVSNVLEREINATFDRQNESSGMFRTWGILAPMFGLLGTLVGIVGVLSEISQPEKVGGAMAISMTTAFYGIALSNMICVPIANKLRLRNMEELRARSLVRDGVVMMMRGTLPLIVERKLSAEL
jgi:chemotaxis protein MotA